MPSKVDFYRQMQRDPLVDEDTADEANGYSSDAGFRNIHRAAVRGAPDDVTVLPSRGFRLANRTSYTPGQESVIRSAALTEAGREDQVPLTATINGKSFAMAPSTNVGTNKAQAYLAAEKERRAEALAADELQRKRQLEDRAFSEAAKDRQTMRDRQASQDRMDYAKFEQGYLDAEANRARAGRTANLQDKLLEAQTENAITDARERISPAQQAQIGVFQKLLENPSLSPSSRAAIQARLADLSRINLDTETLADISRPSAGQSSQQALEASNSALVAPIVQRAIAEAQNVYKGRSVTDMGSDDSLLGTIAGAAPRFVFGGRGIFDQSTGGLEKIFAQAVQAAKQYNPGLDENTLRQIIANQILAEIPQDRSRASQAIMKALMSGGAPAQAAPAAGPATSTGREPMLARLDGGGPAF